MKVQITEVLLYNRFEQTIYSPRLRLAQTHSDLIERANLNNPYKRCEIVVTRY